MLWQPSLPSRYLEMTDDELAAGIDARRRELGDDLLILGHHYQQDEVIQHADLTGDSLKLSQMAAAEAAKRGTKFIVFCGVHFMAETADIVTDDSVQVILPDLSAGCSMADMAEYEDVVEAWEEIHEASRHQGTKAPKARHQGIEAPRHRGKGTDAPRGQGLEGDARIESLDASMPHASMPSPRLIPITYVNSSAAVKAFVGERGGACCTSTNAAAVFEWALNGGTQPVADDEEIKIIFLPDQHLGRNTASKFGLLTEVDEAAGRGKSQTAVWNPRHVGGAGGRGGLTDEQIREAKVLLWAGHCSVHKLFRPEHVDQAREQFADAGGVTVLVHPECCKEVVDKADLSGSTEYIIRQIENALPQSNWAVGTEVHLVNRLANAAKHRGVNVRMLSDCQCLCTTMYRIDQPHLLWSLDRIIEGRPANIIKVPKQAADLARLALERMLALVGDQQKNVQREPALVD